MGYLHALVRSFDEKELQQLGRLNLAGKEKLVWDEFVRPGQKGIDELALRTNLNISKSHFDKINSVLFDKALTCLAGNDLQNKVEFLINKHLYDLALHELKLREKKLQQAGDKKQLKEFYGLAFRTVVLFNFHYFQEKKMVQYCQAYVQLLGKNETGEKYRALAKCEEMLIRYHASRKEGSKTRETALKKLLQWQKDIAGKNLPEAEYGIYLGLSAYYESIEPETGLRYFEKAYAITQRVPGKFLEREKAFVAAMIAQQLVGLSRYEEGIAKYEHLFRNFTSIAAARVYHPFQFVFALLIVKDFKRAQEVMKKHLDPFLKNENARNFHFDILRLHAIMHLLNKETDKAGTYLQKILQFGKQDFTPLGDLLFRLVHNVYCAQTGDYELALSMLRKNLKYLDGKPEIESFDDYKKLFLDLGKVIRHKIKSANNKKAQPLQLEEGEGRSRLYINLIKSAV